MKEVHVSSAGILRTRQALGMGKSEEAWGGGATRPILVSEVTQHIVRNSPGLHANFLGSSLWDAEMKGRAAT